MKLGGYSHPINRNIFQEVYFKEFADRVGCDLYGFFNAGKEYGYENDVFKVTPYNWNAECTCGVNDDDEDHNYDCELMQPNFWYKPTDFKLVWYKYALRDAYANQNISIEEFKRILKHCVASYKTTNKIQK